MPREITPATALEVFVEGFCFTRSFTHPFLSERLSENLWRLYDAPRRRPSATYRGEEYVAWELPPAEIDRQARARARDKFTICYLLPTGTGDTAMRAAFKALGYRLMATEPFLVHDLTDIPTVSERFPVQRVLTAEQAEALAKTAGRRQILPEFLTQDPPPMRQYIALDEAVPQTVGWVSSVAAAGCGWCNSMFVLTAYRRQGIARALLARMLTDDKAAGATANVLLASHVGALLYPSVGYQQIGTLYLYTPPRRAS
ncbi:GNAT family N-acetyltransferase [Armatimonas sp.]|uniref:GNAT family N-acetyltransferase n=1 Tax=Armatimonas sp. TaxID=1872638 RepID=UPI00374FE535